MPYQLRYLSLLDSLLFCVCKNVQKTKFRKVKKDRVQHSNLLIQFKWILINPTVKILNAWSACCEYSQILSIFYRCYTTRFVLPIIVDLLKVRPPVTLLYKAEQIFNCSFQMKIHSNNDVKATANYPEFQMNSGTCALLVCCVHILCCTLKLDQLIVIWKTA